MPRLGKKITHEEAGLLVALGGKEGKDFLAGSGCTITAFTRAARRCPESEAYQIRMTEKFLGGTRWDEYYLVEYDEDGR